MGRCDREAGSNTCPIGKHATIGNAFIEGRAFPLLRVCHNSQNENKKLVVCPFMAIPLNAWIRLEVA